MEQGRIDRYSPRHLTKGEERWCRIISAVAKMYTTWKEVGRGARNKASKLASAVVVRREEGQSVLITPRYLG